MVDIPFDVTLVIFVALLSLALAVFTLVFLLINRLRRTIKRSRFQYVRYLTFSQNISRFILVILWITISMAMLFLAIFIQSYTNFTKQELVALVHTVTVEEEEPTMVLELTPVVDGEKQKTRRFLLRGEQWALEGNIIKWDDWLNFAGIHTMYKLTRLRGRFENSDDERNERPTVVSLISDEEQPNWRWLYKYGHKLRFISAVYGNTVFTYPSEEYLYEIYVTTSGFALKVKEL